MKLIIAALLCGCTAPSNDVGELQNGIYDVTTTVVSDTCLYDGQPTAYPSPRQAGLLTDGTVLQLIFAEPVGAGRALESSYTLEPSNDYHAHLDINVTCNHHSVDVVASDLTATGLHVDKTDDFVISCAPSEPDASCTTSIDQTYELVTVCPSQCFNEEPPGELHCCPSP